MGARATDEGIAVLLGLLDEAFDAKAWHGTNLRGAVRGLGARAAAWRPGPSRHSIRELVVHAAYWKYAVRRRLLGEKRGSFALAGSNWFARPDAPDEKGWRADVALLLEEHAKLRAVVARYPKAALVRRSKGSRFTALRLIQGAACHDIYHAGQIQILKRLQDA
jgi:DinB superfamily